MSIRNVQLTVDQQRFVEQQIEAGRYRNASEVLCAGLRLLEQQEQEDQERLQLLRALAKEAFEQIDQGAGIELESDQQLKDYVAQIGLQAARSKTRVSGR